MMSVKTFNISFPEVLANQIDKKAKEQFGSRSDFLRTAAIKYLREEQEFEELMAYGKQIGKEISNKTEKQVARDITAKRRQQGGAMSIGELKKRVDEIIAESDDDEAAHSHEDSLYIELLVEYLPADLLKEVIRLQEADFARWCA